ncbi:MAG: AI-2E family transporter [Limisphaerales bacterium]
MKPPTANQSRILWLAVIGLSIATLVGLLVAGIWGLGRLLDLLSPVLWPLAIAAVVAYLLDPVVGWLESRKVPRTRAIVLVFVVALSLVTTVLASVIPQVVVEVHQLIIKAPTYVSNLRQRGEEWVARSPDFVRQVLPVRDVPLETNAAIVVTNAVAETNSFTLTNLATTTTNSPATNAPTVLLDRETLSTAGNWLAGNLPTIGSWLFGQSSKVGAWFGVLAGLALIPVYAFYFLVEKRGIKTHWKDYLPVRDSDVKNELVFVLDSINEYLIAFFRGQVLVGICNGVLYTIGFLCIGLNYAFLIGLSAVLLTIIPYLGAIIVFITALTLALVQYGDWTHPLMVVGVFAVVQTLESFYISPKIIGDRVGLHPVVIIIAVMTGTTLLGGLLGGVLAIPLAAALRVIMFRYVWKKRSD